VSEEATENVEAREAYRSGKVGFMGLELFAAPGALVPRKETEILARAAIQRLAALAASSSAPLVIVDMCCGAGNLACSLAVNVPQSRLFACDLTDGCVGLAQRNIEKLGLASRVQVRQGDLFQSLAGAGVEGSVDAIVCNPPYISSSRLEKRSDLECEPREAFDGGPYGLSIHQRVIREADAFLKPGGWLMFEFGKGQERQLELLFQRGRIYEQAELIRGENDEPRVAVARRRQTTS
jgi:HemK-like putative methylase